MIVSVVGHGASCKGFGTEIDRSDIVIRMADCDWHTEEDHGRKYDIGVLRDAKRYWKVLSGIKAIRMPAQGWWLYRHAVVRDAETYWSLPVEVMPNADVPHTQRGFKLTRGGMAAVHAVRKMKPSVLKLWGFDFVAAGEYRGSPHALHRESYNPKLEGAKIDGPHNYPVERAFILGLGVPVMHNGEVMA